MVNAGSSPKSLVRRVSEQICSYGRFLHEAQCLLLTKVLLGFCRRQYLPCLLPLEDSIYLPVDLPNL